ncbi:hypothetical protein H632_c2344p0 [Helicosporidium sp. ATCC 50920]|nr:hypothetical protein H632_c2344p0 [Helicosporidium sp. ATCC 50920]|eukprot:KDD73284.1 hypothetical protein H632_c2344p0 [Helicosporidium sp. ATCC 50920]
MGDSQRAADTLLAQLMGAEKSQMNLAKLRSRALDLRRHVEEMLFVLHSSADRMTWTWALDKFAVFNTVWQQTLDELRPLLRHYAVRPLAVNQSTAALVPIQMATKPLPGMEAEEAKSLQAMGDLEPAEVEKHVRALNSTLDSIMVYRGPGTGALDPKAPSRRAMHEAVTAAGAGSLAASTPSQGPASAPPADESTSLLLAAIYGGQR